MKAGARHCRMTCDIERRAERSRRAIADTAAESFGGIDILGTNASAQRLTRHLQTPMKRFDLGNEQDQPGGTFMSSRRRAASAEGRQ